MTLIFNSSARSGRSPAFTVSQLGGMSLSLVAPADPFTEHGLPVPGVYFKKPIDVRPGAVAASSSAGSAAIHPLNTCHSEVALGVAQVRRLLSSR
jgi:hypothetical protein